MRQFAFILISLFARLAGTVVSAQVTTKFKADRQSSARGRWPCGMSRDGSQSIEGGFSASVRTELEVA